MKAITITSGKGGVGKTNVAINLALTLGEAGHRTLLLDADLGLANADLLLGVTPKATLADVLFQGLSLRDALLALNEKVSLIPASSGIRELERLSPDKRSLLRNALEGLDETFDFLIIDTSAGIGDNVMFFCEMADIVLLVTVPEPTALTDAYAMIKVLGKIHGRTELSVIVNQAPSASAAATVHSRLADVATRFVGVAVNMAGYLPTDGGIVRAVSAQVPLVQSDPAAPFSRAIRVLATKLTQQLRAQAQTQSRVFGRPPEKQLA